MTRTEQRLADALASIASGIPDESLRGLNTTAPADVTARPRRPALRWLTPAAAATAVAAIIGLVAGISRIAPDELAARFRDAATATSPPPYYVAIGGANADVLEVHATAGGALGRLTDEIQPPRGWYATGSDSFFQGFEPAAVASAGDRTFVVAYNNPVIRQTGLYRFGLTRAGKVTDFAPVPGGALPGMANPTLAVSPDGSRVAVAGTPDPRNLNEDAVAPPLIIVVNLDTGVRRDWRGGLNRQGWQLSIPSVSWTPHGTSLVFVAQQCRPHLSSPSTASCDIGTGPVVSPEGPVAQVEQISADGPGGRLGSGRVLLRGSSRYPEVLQAVVTPGGDLIALVAHGTHPYLVRFALPSGRLLGVVWNGNWLAALTIALGLDSAALSSDASGRYFIISWNQGTPTVWTARGRCHYLGQGNVYSATW